MKVGDPVLVVSVTQDDITRHTNGDVYKTSLGLAVIRQVDNAYMGAISLGQTKMNVGGYLYDLDPQSVAFCNTEVAGISVTIPYTATLTFATF